MIQEVLNEREFELINIIGTEIANNQRDLSRQMKLSLGMTNLIIRRLVSKGYIRIRQLNKRKVEYILTPKGFAEKMRKSVHYTVKTIRSVGLLKERIKEILSQLYAQGHRHFWAVGSSDLAVLIEMVLKEAAWPDVRLKSAAEIPREPVEGIVLICTEEVMAIKDKPNHCVDMIAALAEKM